MLNYIPNGPSITTVDWAASGEKRPFFRPEGGRTLKFTSGGIDNGARPICDGRLVDAENDREGTIGKAGRRNAGKEADGEDAIALSIPFDRTVENIAVLTSLHDAEARGSRFWISRSSFGT